MNTVWTDRWAVYLNGLAEAEVIGKDKKFSVLETGRMRRRTDEYFYGDGASTLLFALQANVNFVYSIDNDQESEKICRDILGESADKVKFINEDSLAAIPSIARFKKNKQFGAVLLDSAEDPIHCALEFISCVHYGIIDNYTVLLLDDIETKSTYIINAIKEIDQKKMTQSFISVGDKNIAVKSINYYDISILLKKQLFGDSFDIASFNKGE